MCILYIQSVYLLSEISYMMRVYLHYYVYTVPLISLLHLKEKRRSSLELLCSDSKPVMTESSGQLYRRGPSQLFTMPEEMDPSD